MCYITYLGKSNSLTYPPLESGRGKTGGGTSSSSGLGEIALGKRRQDAREKGLQIEFIPLQKRTLYLFPSMSNYCLLDVGTSKGEI